MQQQAALTITANDCKGAEVVTRQLIGNIAASETWARHCGAQGKVSMSGTELAVREPATLAHPTQFD
jgi:hypothetical protein